MHLDLQAFWIKIDLKFKITQLKVLYKQDGNNKGSFPLQNYLWPDYIYC